MDKRFASKCENFTVISFSVSNKFIMLPCLKVFLFVFHFSSNIVLLLPWWRELQQILGRLSQKINIFLFLCFYFVFLLAISFKTTKCLEKYLKLISNVLMKKTQRIINNGKNNKIKVFHFFLHAFCCCFSEDKQNAAFSLILERKHVYFMIVYATFFVFRLFY